MRTVDLGDIYICSVYLDGNVMDLPEALTKLLQEAGDMPIIIGMDSNCHSGMWGDKKTDAWGKWLETVLFQNNLVIANIGDMPTFVTSIVSAVIDLMVCTPSILNQIRDWHVNPEDQESDHRRLEFDLMEAPPKPPRTWDIKNANWKLFTENLASRSSQWLEREPSRSWDKEALDLEAKQLKKDINCSLGKATRLVQPGTCKVKLHWWTSELDGPTL